MAQPPQLRPGARATIDLMHEAVQRAAQSAKLIDPANPDAIDKEVLIILNALYELKDRIREELEPQLRRAGGDLNEPSLEARVRKLEEFVSAYMQHAAQHV
jgi:hypothetical protein